MALTAAAITPTQMSNLKEGEGYKVMATLTWDAIYPTGGETIDLSAFFPTEVFGGTNIADTLNDGGYECTYTRAVAGAPATGVIQAWWTNNDAGGVQDPLIEVADMTDVSAMNSQRWIFFGR